MNHSFYYYLAALLFLATPISARAESTGNELLKQCSAVIRFQDNNGVKDPKEAVDSMFCLGLVQGVMNTNEIYQVIAKDKALFCVPGSVKNGQGARIVVKYLNEHPEKLHINDTVLVVSAMREAFPCPPQ